MAVGLGAHILTETGGFRKAHSGHYFDPSNGFISDFEHQIREAPMHLVSIARRAPRTAFNVRQPFHGANGWSR